MRRILDPHLIHSPLPRFAQLAFVCLAACLCARLNAQGCIFQSDNGQPYYRHWSFKAQTGAPQGSQLKVVALGDSVVWGDGDKPEHKIVWLVSQNLANDTGRTVELHSYAHSGARLQYAPGAPAKFPVMKMREQGIGIHPGKSTLSRIFRAC